jgi:hypothetical protein
MLHRGGWAGARTGPAWCTWCGSASWGTQPWPAAAEPSTRDDIPPSTRDDIPPRHPGIDEPVYIPDWIRATFSDRPAPPPNPYAPTYLPVEV